MRFYHVLPSNKNELAVRTFERVSVLVPALGDAGCGAANIMHDASWAMLNPIFGGQV